MSLINIDQHSLRNSANRNDVSKRTTLDTRISHPELSDQANSLLSTPTKFEQTIASIGTVIPGIGLPIQSDLEQMMQQADELRTGPSNETMTEIMTRYTELGRLEDKIEQKVVELLEYQTTNNGPLSVDDLENLAAQPDSIFVNDAALAAQYVLDNPELFNELDSASNGELDGSISLSDFHQHQLNNTEDIKNQVEAPDTEDDYTVPSEATNSHAGTDEPNRTPELYASQQDAIEAAIKSGEPTSFTNSNGEVITVTIEAVPGTNTPTYLKPVTDAPTYNVSLDDGTQFKVESELTASETIEAIANVIEWGSTSDAADGIRRYPRNLRFVQESHPNGWAASYRSVPAHTMTFYNGTSTIEQGLYYHEIAHGIGYDLAEPTPSLGIQDGELVITETKNSAIPSGWDDVVADAEAAGIGAVSAYPGSYDNDVDRLEEDFSEAYAAYMTARDHGPEALEEFRQAYPYRSAYIEQHIMAQPAAPGTI